METYIVSFSLEVSKDLKQRYEAIVEKLKGLVSKKESDVVQFTKTCFLVRYFNRKRDFIRDLVTKELKKGNSDGRVLVIEVARSAWTCHWEDKNNDAELGRKLRKMISEED